VGNPSKKKPIVDILRKNKVCMAVCRTNIVIMQCVDAQVFMVYIIGKLVLDVIHARRVFGDEKGC
jgi:hypothetical protein